MRLQRVVDDGFWAIAVTGCVPVFLLSVVGALLRITVRLVKWVCETVRWGGVVMAEGCINAVVIF